MESNKRVFILGSDKIGWSIDKDRFYTIKAIKELANYEITENILRADIIYVVWWNQILSWKFKLLNFFLKKNIVVCITNDLTHQQTEIKSILKKVNIFVYANSIQREQLVNLKVNEDKLFFNPFYVDETIFKKMTLSKKNICEKFDIDYTKVENKFLIGSFQRDGLGEDLLKPKWQKNPDMLINILKKLNSTNYLLILVGPRRHYVIDKCEELGINYIFVGNKSYIDNHQDDLLTNALQVEDMPYLYNLIDLYIVSSKSEGGPKAISEAVLCDTNIISTDVGFAKDLLDEESIYKDEYEAVDKIENIFNHNFNHKVKKYYTFNKFKQRIQNILGQIK